MWKVRRVGVYLTLSNPPQKIKVFISTIFRVNVIIDLIYRENMPKNLLFHTYNLAYFLFSRGLGGGGQTIPHSRLHGVYDGMLVHIIHYVLLA